MASAAIGCSASGDNVIVAATTGKFIKITSLFLMAASDVTVYLKSATTGTEIIGKAANPLPLSANGGMVLNYNHGPDGWGRTVAGEALEVVLSSGVSVSGVIGYELLPTGS